MNDYNDIPVTDSEDEEFNRISSSRRADQIDPPLHGRETAGEFKTFGSVQEERKPITYDDIKHIQLVDVVRPEGKDGHLLKVGYDAETKLGVGVFVKGTYGYRGVPEGDGKSIVETARIAEVSTGALFNRIIRPIKDYNIVEIPVLARAERNDTLAPEEAVEQEPRSVTFDDILLEETERFHRQQEVE